MTQPNPWMTNLADLTEAARLTRAGRLQEAASLIQRGLSGTGRSGLRATSGPGVETPESERSAPGDIHTAIFPERMRDAFGQIMRGLRKGSPVFRGFGETRAPSRQPVQDDERFVERNFANSAGARAYKLFVPDAANGRRPLVVMLHGCTQSPDDFAAGTGMNALAAAEGIYVAYPQQSQRANGHKCWNWFQPGDQGREQGEAGIIAGITRAIIAEHPIDPERVYIAGLSAGGAAAANIARAYPDLYAAVGVHSGLAAGCARDLASALMAMKAGAPGLDAPGATSGFGGGSSTAIRVPTIVFHGDGDETVNPRNGEAVLAQAGIADLTASRESGQEPGGHGYVRTRYADASGRVQVEAWLVKGSGHAWSGGKVSGSYTDPRGPDASRAMLDFFETHTLGESLRA